ncbi:MAG TPA: SurA N-terminal domain-containing protein [Chthonomonadaceae bacterium]|nr:SurA N-terminal domain-containing protein [Chthonomonadaceae bacterium]
MPDLFSISAWQRWWQRAGRACGWILAAVFGIPLVISFGLSQYTRGNQPNPAAERSAVIARVNGEPITNAEFNQLAGELTRQGAEPGPQFASAQGMALENLIKQTALIQEAQRRRLHPSEADIDSAIAQQRAQLRNTFGHEVSDSEWESYLESRFGMTPGEYRDFLSKQLLIPALFQDIKNQINVTEADANNQYAEVKLALVLIPSGPTPLPNPKGIKPLPDAEARKKADDLRAQVEKGADIAAIARANSADPSAKTGGTLDWRREYQGIPGAPDMLGILHYGKEFDEAVHKTPKGQLTPVVKITGFQQGYGFARVLDRRINKPKDFDPKKEVEQIKDTRAREAFGKLINDLMQKARIEVVDPDKKAYYDFVKLQEMQQQQFLGQMGRAPEGAPPPTPADIEKQQALVENEFDALLKRHPEDETAALIVAQNLKSKKITAPNEIAQRNQRLIQLYEMVLTRTENRQIRFDLASLYRETKQNDKALQQYEKIQRLLNDAPPYDLTTMQEAQQVHQQLAAGFRSLNKPDQAAQEEAAVKDLEGKIKAERDKVSAEQRHAALQAPNISLPGGGKGTIQKTLPVPGSAAKPAGQPPAATPPAPGTGKAPEAPGAARPTPQAQPAVPAAPKAAGESQPKAGKPGP